MVTSPTVGIKRGNRNGKDGISLMSLMPLITSSSRGKFGLWQPACLVVCECGSSRVDHYHGFFGELRVSTTNGFANVLQP